MSRRKRALPETPRDLFKQYLSEVYAGERARLARDLQVSPSLVTRLANGEREITPRVALRLEQLSGRRYRKEGFIWPEETRAVAAAAAVSTGFRP